MISEQHKRVSIDWLKVLKAGTITLRQGKRGSDWKCFSSNDYVATFVLLTIEMVDVFRAFMWSKLWWISVAWSVSRNRMDRTTTPLLTFHQTCVRHPMQEKCSAEWPNRLPMQSNMVRSHVSYKTFTSWKTSHSLNCQSRRSLSRRSLRCCHAGWQSTIRTNSLSAFSSLFARCSPLSRTSFTKCPQVKSSTPLISTWKLIHLVLTKWSRCWATSAEQSTLARALRCSQDARRHTLKALTSRSDPDTGITLVDALTRTTCTWDHPWLTQRLSSWTSWRETRTWSCTVTRMLTTIVAISRTCAAFKSQESNRRLFWTIAGRVTCSTLFLTLNWWVSSNTWLTEALFECFRDDLERLLSDWEGPHELDQSHVWPDWTVGIRQGVCHDA